MRGNWPDRDRKIDNHLPNSLTGATTATEAALGHNRLPRLPASKRWQEVTELLGSDAPDEEVVAAAAEAAQTSFAHAVRDTVYAEAVRLLVVVAHAARDHDFEASLTRNGLNAGVDPSLIDLLNAIGLRLDAAGADSGSSADLGELARRALLGTLHDKLLPEMPGLLDNAPGDLRTATKVFCEPHGFSELARAFYTRMTSETLAYWLDRTMGAQVGAHRRFTDINGRADFDVALKQFSAEATAIIHQFSAGWYAKHTIDRVQDFTESSKAFAAVAFKKINDELRRKTGSDA